MVGEDANWDAAGPLQLDGESLSPVGWNSVPGPRRMLSPRKRPEAGGRASLRLFSEMQPVSCWTPVMNLSPGTHKESLEDTCVSPRGPRVSLFMRPWPFNWKRPSPLKPREGSASPCDLRTCSASAHARPAGRHRLSVFREIASSPAAASPLASFLHLIELKSAFDRDLIAYMGVTFPQPQILKSWIFVPKLGFFKKSIKIH